MRSTIDRWLPVAAAIALLLAALPAGAAGKAKRTLAGVVNLNTAPAEQLSLLPGIGVAVAKRIVDARAEKPFERTWEITRVKGVGPKLFHKLEDRLRVEGVSDLRWVEPPKLVKRAGKRRRGPKILTFSKASPHGALVGPPVAAAAREGPR